MIFFPNKKIFQFNSYTAQALLFLSDIDFGKKYLKHGWMIFKLISGSKLKVFENSTNWIYSFN